MRIEGIPEGYELNRIGTPNIGDNVLDRMGCVFVCEVDNYDYKNWPILRKIEKPKKYRPFANAEEFKPHRDRWVRRANASHADRRGAWRASYYTERSAVVTESDEITTYRDIFEAGYVFDDDGTPFGIEVTE